MPKGDTSSFTIKIIKLLGNLQNMRIRDVFCPLLNFSLVSLILDILSGALS